MSAGHSADDYVELARLAEHAERYDDMAKVSPLYCI